MDDPGLPPAHPRFAAHFTDPWYDDVADEYAPFGSDEGWDLVMEWGERRDELGPSSTVADVLEGGWFPDAVQVFRQLPDDSEEILEGRDGPIIIANPMGKIDAATFLVSGAFTLLRLTGQIDPGGMRDALAALDYFLRNDPTSTELARMKADLLSWP